MDINSLLSPSESPRSTPAPSNPPSNKKPRKTRTNKVAASAPKSSRPTSAPRSQSNSTTEPDLTLSTSYPITRASQNASQSSQSISPGAGLPRSAGTTPPPTERVRPTRQPSTPGMDALADLATMQHHQQTARVNAGGLRNTDIYDTPVSTTGHLPTIPTIPGTQDSPVLRGPAFDRSAIDPPTRAPSPRQLMASTLSEADQEKVTELAATITSDPFAYGAHAQLINILHQGLVDHLRLQGDGDTPRDPHSYELLRELKDARETMNSKFGLGEDMLADWIQDRISLASSLEDRVTVMELCQKSIEEEPISSKLWLTYAQWMLSLYETAHGPGDKAVEGSLTSSHPAGWSEEERTMAREVFTWQQVLGVWHEGAQATMLRINDSHLLWDPYTELKVQELGNSPSSDAIQAMDSHFRSRLQVPHATWDQTFSAYSTFVSKYDNANYEGRMVAVGQAARTAKQKYEMRDSRELGLSQAAQQGDQARELQRFQEYFEFERGLSHRKNAFDFDLLNLLYQRALLKFPANADLWETYVMFLNEDVTDLLRRKSLVLPALQHATRHCPWSGNLWASYFLAAEVANLSFTEIGEIKHKATSTGLLDAGSMEEVLKVYTAWCGYLRRRAFGQSATDEERDVAEVGIRSAIEDMETAGRAKYGKTFQGDPDYRLEKIYIKYFTQCGNFEAVRETYKKLVARKGDSYEFWLRYYTWEMMIWCRLAYKENQGHDVKYLQPVEATKVLQQALKVTTMDWPEKIIETYKYHCEDHEDAETQQQALLHVSKATKTAQKRREAEAYEAYQANQSNALHKQAQGEEDIEMQDADAASGKRKRDDETDGAPAKRPREDAVPDNDGHEGETGPSALKRDRENATIVVRNLAAQTTELKVRQFFRDCGPINSVKLSNDGSRMDVTATIEFESKDDAIAATTKDQKTLDGNIITVQVGKGSTLYVCNFPPTAGEGWIRDKFQPFGEIVDVRFPSLKYNTHRRFCYVQFKTSSQAQEATQLDGEDQGDSIKLLAKLSDPSHRQDRRGAMYEGRELFLANVDWGITEKDLKQTFAQYGYVESVRVPKKVNGQSRGIAYIVFRDKENANAALEKNLSRFHGRVLNVSLSTNDMAKRQANQIITSGPSSRRNSNSPIPSAEATTNGSRRIASNKVESPEPAPNLSAEIQTRTLGLMNIPDTMNDARVRALVEEYGELVKVVLRPDHSGAIVEFKDVNSVGKAALGLEGREIDSGRYIAVGTVAQMMKGKAEKKSNKTEAVPKAKLQGLQGPPPVRRPVQPGSRRGGKGGLGIKGAGVGLSRTRVPGESKSTKAGEESGESEKTNGQAAPKSNADFRNLLLRD